MNLEHFKNIEDKIPSVFSSYEEAGIKLAQEIYQTWNIDDGEIIRVISLINMRTNINLLNHINTMFSFCGLYPERIKTHNIFHEHIQKNKKIC